MLIILLYNLFIPIVNDEQLMLLNLIDPIEIMIH